MLYLIGSENLVRERRQEDFCTLSSLDKWFRRVPPWNFAHVLLEILQEGSNFFFLEKCHWGGDRRGQSGVSPSPGTRSSHPLPRMPFAIIFLPILISVVGISPCAKFHSPTLQGGVEQGVLLCGSERESCQKWGKKTSAVFQSWQMVSKS